MLTGCVDERKFTACWPSFLGVLFLDILLLNPRSWILVPDVLFSFLMFSFLAFGSWALQFGGPGGFRLTRQSSASAWPPTVAPPARCGWRVIAGEL
jgi:hypothetical protein